MDNIEEPLELVPDTMYRKWWCQECGTTLYEEMEDQGMEMDDPTITYGFNNQWVRHHNQMHKIVAISIFKHAHIVLPIPSPSRTENSSW